MTKKTEHKRKEKTQGKEKKGDESVCVHVGFRPLSSTDLKKMAGYSGRAGESVGKMLQKRTFQEVLDEQMPADWMVSLHKGLAETRKMEYMPFPPDTPDDRIHEMIAEINCVLRSIEKTDERKIAYYYSFDPNARAKALDMLYQITGKYKEPAQNPTNAYKTLSDKDLEERKRQAQKFLRKDDGSTEGKEG